MQKNYRLYNNIGYWFVGFLLLVGTGFYRTYFAILLRPQPLSIHVHFLLMLVWIGMLIAQPFLIRGKKIGAHRMIGKLSYFLVPLIIFSGLLMLRYGYYHHIHMLEQNMTNTLTAYELHVEAANHTSRAVYYLGWFTVFYVLAVYFRKKTAFHARFMIANALSLTGATVDRTIDTFWPGDYALWTYVPPETIAFLIIDFLLVYILYRDYVMKRSLRPMVTALCLYIIGQIGYFATLNTPALNNFMEIIMRPVP